MLQGEIQTVALLYQEFIIINNISSPFIYYELLLENLDSFRLQSKICVLQNDK